MSCQKDEAGRLQNELEKSQGLRPCLKEHSARSWVILFCAFGSQIIGAFVARSSSVFYVAYLQEFGETKEKTGK